MVIFLLLLLAKCETVSCLISQLSIFGLVGISGRVFASLPHEHNYSSSFLYFSHPAPQINDMGDTAALLLCGKRVHKESPNCQGCGKYVAMYSTSVNTYTSDIFHFISTQRFMDPRKDPNSCLA